MIEWVFFDVGSVLFNDDRQNYRGYRIALDLIREQQPDYTFSRMLSDRERIAGDGARWILHELIRRVLDLDEQSARSVTWRIFRQLTEDYDDVHLVNDGLPEVLDILRENYRLGVIANQPPECRASLERRGLLEYFDVLAISDELQLHKPDPQIFQWAIQAADCPPDATVMVGDRGDNDIAPAIACDMRTILVKWPGWRQRRWQPTEDADAIAFLESCDRIPRFAATAADEAADQKVSSLREVPLAVESLTPSDA